MCFIFPYPFSKIVFLWGDPVYVDRDASKADLETERLKLEQTLTELSRRADEMACGN